MVEGPPGPGGLSYGRARLSSSKILVDARGVAGDVAQLSCEVSVTRRPSRGLVRAVRDRQGLRALNQTLSVQVRVPYLCMRRIASPLLG